MLNKLTLTNFKCFESEEIDLKPLTLLSGINGMGKSTVIQALLLLRQNYNRFSKDINNTFILNDQLVQLGTVKDLLYQYFTKKEIIIKIELDENEECEFMLNCVDTNNDTVPSKSTLSENIPFYGESLFSENFHYLNAERIGPRNYYETSQSKIKHENQLGIRGEYAAHYFAENRSNPIAIKGLGHKNSTGDTLYEQLNAWLSEIRPGTKIDASNNYDMNLVSLSYRFIGGMDISNTFRPINVGFGLTYIFPLLVIILSSKPGTLLLLENPEAHLHPAGQAQIGKLLAIAAAHGIQIIVETHSDHILNGIRVAVKEGDIEPEKVNFLYFKGDVINGKFIHFTENVEIYKNGKLSHRPVGFFDEWDKQLTNLI